MPRDPKDRQTDNSRSDKHITRADARSLVDESADMQRRVYAAGDRYRVCGERELERKHGYAKAYVRGAQSKLESLGFRRAGDIQDVIVSGEMKWFAKPTILRTFVNNEGTVAAAYVVKMRRLGWLASLFGLIPKIIRTIDLGTELTDGRFVMTGNTLGLNTMDPPPEIVRRQLDPTTPIDELVSEHSKQLAKTLADAGPDVAVRPARTIDDVIAGAMRENDIKRRHKQRRGYAPTANELRLANDGKIDKLTSLAMEEADRRGQRGA